MKMQVTMQVTNEKEVPLPDGDDDLQFSLSDSNDDLPTPPSSKKNTPKITLDPLPRAIHKPNLREKPFTDLKIHMFTAHEENNPIFVNPV